MKITIYIIALLFAFAGCVIAGSDDKGGEKSITGPSIIPKEEITIISNELVYAPGAANCFYGYAVIKNTGNVDLASLSYKYWGGDILEGIGDMFSLEEGEIFIVDTRDKIRFAGGAMPSRNYAGLLRIYNHQMSPKIQMTFDVAQLTII